MHSNKGFTHLEEEHDDQMLGDNTVPKGMPGQYQPPSVHSPPPYTPYGQGQGQAHAVPMQSYPPHAPQYGVMPVVNHSSSTTVVVNQPMGAPPVVMPPPPNYTVPAILVTLFCNLICGIIAILKASGAKEAYARGNGVEAHMKARTARNLIIISIVCGIIGYVILAIRIAAVVQQLEDDDHNSY